VFDTDKSDAEDRHQQDSPHVGSRYPAPFAALCAAREKRALGDAAGLTQFTNPLNPTPPDTAPEEQTR
jgi:uncharacterized cupin superfamily protein